MLKKFILFIFLLLLIFGGIAGFNFYKSNQNQIISQINNYKINNPNQNSSKASQVCISKNCFDVKLARTETERETGLMNVKNLPQGSGMLFIFENDGIYPFWMKNTLIPLDIIWMDKDYKVVYIKEKAIPCTTEACEILNPKFSARYVLEVNSGSVAKNGIKLGNKFDFKQ